MTKLWCTPPSQPYKQPPAYCRTRHASRASPSTSPRSEYADAAAPRRPPSRRLSSSPAVTVLRSSRRF
eukprot:342964-Chlamydomonas_euryale.AAC.1